MTIPDHIAAAIDDALLQVEREHEARILYANESGSRAWGFASPDSDYDIRFIYVKPLDWYLSVTPGRDVVTAMLPLELDLSGWELRKALGLFLTCNCSMNEWLGSPIVYRDDSGLADRLRTLLPTVFNPIKACHHYRKVAEVSRDQNLVGQRISIKKLFYVLRPLLACEWICAEGSQPPTAFADLLAADLAPAAIRGHIDDFLEQKADAAEGFQVELPTELTRWFDARLVYHAAAHERLSAGEKLEISYLDAILRDFIHKFAV